MNGEAQALDTRPPVVVARGSRARASMLGHMGLAARGMWDLPGPGNDPDLCPLHWQVDSQLSDHQGTPR